MFLASFVPAVHAQTIHVTTFADNVPGSLRAAITQANSSCTTIPCTIVFDAPGTYDVNTTARPTITQTNVIIDGGTVATGWAPNTNPFGQADHAVIGVAIQRSGNFAIDGITFDFQADGGGVFNVAIGGFNRAIVINTSGCTIAGNFIGTDQSGSTALANVTGVD
ncbi:MAG: hypothetical protein ACXW29_13690, partial [Thermoanaerobaculia bacterium]